MPNRAETPQANNLRTRAERLLAQIPPPNLVRDLLAALDAAEQRIATLEQRLRRTGFCPVCQGVGEIAVSTPSSSENDIMECPSCQASGNYQPDGVHQLVDALVAEITTLHAEQAKVATLEQERDEARLKHGVACQTIQAMQDEREQRRSQQALAALSFSLGQGMGDHTTSADSYERRIREGIDTIIRVETQRREAAESRLTAVEQAYETLHRAEVERRMKEMPTPVLPRVDPDPFRS